jgi:hypothetical protein
MVESRRIERAAVLQISRSSGVGEEAGRGATVLRLARSEAVVLG